VDRFCTDRKVTALERLTQLEVADARLFALRQQAIADLEDVCLQQDDKAHAEKFLPLEVAVACEIAQSTAMVGSGRPAS